MNRLASAVPRARASVAQPARRLANATFDDWASRLGRSQSGPDHLPKEFIAVEATLVERLADWRFRDNLSLIAYRQGLSHTHTNAAS